MIPGFLGHFQPKRSVAVGSTHTKTPPKRSGRANSTRRAPVRRSACARPQRCRPTPSRPALARIACYCLRVAQMAPSGPPTPLARGQKIPVNGAPTPPARAASAPPPVCGGQGSCPKLFRLACPPSGFNAALSERAKVGAPSKMASHPQLREHLWRQPCLQRAVVTCIEGSHPTQAPRSRAGGVV